MKTVVIHLADFHYRKGWVEEQGVVLNEFFKDLKVQMEKFKNATFYLVFSGDIVQAAASNELYDEFLQDFGNRIEEIGIDKAHRICVPGNHDIFRDIIQEKHIDHEGPISQNLKETDFNNYIQTPSSVYIDKFSPYINFEKKFAKYHTAYSRIYGQGWEVSDAIGVYCLNSALFSSGGFNNISDKRRLAVETRALYSWVMRSSSKWKILILHHPLNWLTDWAEKELRTLLRKNFCLCLTGHVHEQSMLYSIHDDSFLVECMAPPLFTKKTDRLGYSLISIDSDYGVDKIVYRQWTKNHTWLSGVDFSNTENGEVKLRSDQKEKNFVEEDFLSRVFKKNLEDALVTYPSQPLVWVDPLLCKEPERFLWEERGVEKVNLQNLIKNPVTSFIKAPLQFGLTCLSHFLIKSAWQLKHNSFWLYLDATKLSPHIKPIKKSIKKELDFYRLNFKAIKCVVLDSWNNNLKDATLLVKRLCSVLNDIPLIVMESTTDNEIFVVNDFEELERKFECYFLWSLPRGHIRKVIKEYNEDRVVGDEDKVISKVVTDLETLNLHRTPLNCMTLLKVSEIDFDESPVNRTQMVQRVLFLIFNVDEIPTYKTRPDLKDCEYALGYFCEILLRTGKYIFTLDYFLTEVNKFCKEQMLDLETQVVFDVLYFNNIIVGEQGHFHFRFSYWFYYFAAQRMHHDQKFADFILNDLHYTNFPEIIEFYTGIDRRRENALKVLNNDLENHYIHAKDKCGFPDELNPYQFAQWKPTPKAIEQMSEELKQGVLKSNLPDAVKDEYADKTYDSTQPYCQDIKSIISDYSFGSMSLVIRSSARALRNSDYASPEAKITLLKNILLCWDQVAKVTLTISPLLAKDGVVNYDGFGFSLLGKFSDSINERLQEIFLEIPNNILFWYGNDIYSPKMGPLLLKQFNNETDEFKKHLLSILIIKKRPRLWKAEIEKYITSLPKNSFYLLDVYRTLSVEYKYSFASNSSLSDIEYVLRMAIAKHQYGAKKPSPKLIKKVSDQDIPERDPGSL